MTEQEKRECSLPKNEIVESIFGTFCAVRGLETATTAEIVPGSSGGAIVNASGDIIGIASMTDGHFGYIVRLLDIQIFIANY